jgi:hypothetical protein
MVFLGCTPPHSRYFGIQSYVMVSNSTMVFAGIGDPINQLSINTSAQPGEGPFSEETAVITTADQNLEEYLRKALTDLGAGGRINTDALPDPAAIGIDPMGGSAIGKGSVAGHAIFSTLFRVAACEDEAACAGYTSSVWPVLRITPTVPRTPRLYPYPTFKRRGTGTNEAHLQVYIQYIFIISHTLSTTKQHKNQPVSFTEPNIHDNKMH